MADKPLILHHLGFQESKGESFIKWIDWVTFVPNWFRSTNRQWKQQHCFEMAMTAIATKFSCSLSLDYEVSEGVVPRQRGW